MKEFYLLQSLDHPNIVKMHEAYYNKIRETLYFVMDFVEGLTLKNYIKLYRLKHKEYKSETAGGLPEDLCKLLLMKLINVLDYL
jgi:serine/threonine protein kinase